MDGRDKPGRKRLKLDGPRPGMRRADREVVAVRPGEVEGIVDPAPADIGGTETLCAIIAASCLDIVDHQVEGGHGAGFKGVLRLPDDDMRAAAELEDREVGGGENRA